jgi:hypothetical protein
MLRDLEKIINNNQHSFTPENLTAAAARLRQNQFIFKDKRGQNRTYEILLNQQTYFTDLFSAFGDEFFVDTHFGYCGILPSSSKPVLKQLETIFLLILAKMHDLECRKARSENGRTNPSESILLDEYSQITGRDKPKPVETRSALERLAKVGVIELGDINEISEMREIIILPSIMRVVTTSYLESLNAFNVLSIVEEETTDSNSDAVEDDQSL